MENLSKEWPMEKVSSRINNKKLSTRVILKRECTKIKRDTFKVIITTILEVLKREEKKA